MIHGTHLPASTLRAVYPGTRCPARLAASWGGGHRKTLESLPPRQQIFDVVVRAGHLEVGLALEGAGDVHRLVHAIPVDPHDGEVEVLGRVQPGQELVAGDRDGAGARDAAFDLDEAQAAAAGDAGLDVVATLRGAHVMRVV